MRPGAQLCKCSALSCILLLCAAARCACLDEVTLAAYEATIPVDDGDAQAPLRLGSLCPYHALGLLREGEAGGELAEQGAQRLAGQDGWR